MTKKIHLDSVEMLNIDILKIEPDYVIHTAALSNVELCEVNPNLAKFVNVTLSANVAEVCNYYNIPFVHISTDHLFSGEIPFVKEECSPSPLNYYGETKAKAELEVQRKNLKALIIRTNFFGWGPSYRRSFSDIIIDTLRSKKNITLFKDIFYTPILVHLLAKTVIELLEKGFSGIFNVVGNDRISKCDFGMKIAEIFNLDASLIRPISIESKKNLVRRPHDMSLSNTKVTSLLSESLGNIEYNLKMLLLQECNGVNRELKKCL